MKQYTLKYQDQFGIVHTSEYPDQKQFNFWKDIRIAQGYTPIVDTDTEFGTTTPATNIKGSKIL